MLTASCRWDSERAVENGTLARNVAAIRKPPRVEDKELEVLQPAAVTALLAKLDGHPLHPSLVSLALSTGMRRGELLALLWSDVDLDRAVLHVGRSVEETKAGLRVKPPKTPQGRRGLEARQRKRLPCCGNTVSGRSSCG